MEDSRFLLEHSIGTDDDDDLLSRLNFPLDKVTKALVNVNDFDLLVAFVQRLQKPMMSVGLRKRRTEDLLAACVQNAMLINDLISDKVESSSLPEASLKSLVLLVGTLATSEQHGDKARDDLQGLAETLIRAHAPGANDLQIVFKLDGRLLRALPGNLEPFDRHDNDHEDWRKIKVVPTAGEVQTNRLPYIPEALNDEIQETVSFLKRPVCIWNTISDSRERITSDLCVKPRKMAPGENTARWKLRVSTAKLVETNRVTKSIDPAVSR